MEKAPAGARRALPLIKDLRTPIIGCPTSGKYNVSEFLYFNFTKKTHEVCLIGSPLDIFKALKASQNPEFVGALRTWETLKSDSI